MSPNLSAEGIKEDIQRLVDELDKVHKHLRQINKGMEEVEIAAGEIGWERVKFALRAAYVKVSQSGSKLVEAHMDMTIPPTAYEQVGHPEKPKDQSE